MPIATVTAIIGAIAAAASIGGSIASAVGGGDEPKKPERSPQGTLQYRSAVDALSKLKPPDLLQSSKPPTLGGQQPRSIAADLSHNITGGMIDPTPAPQFGSLGGGLTSPQGGFIERANALQGALGANIPSPEFSTPSPEDVRKKFQLGS